MTPRALSRFQREVGVVCECRFTDRLSRSFRLCSLQIVEKRSETREQKEKQTGEEGEDTRENKRNKREGRKGAKFQQRLVDAACATADWATGSSVFENGPEGDAPAIAGQSQCTGR